jgi:hypothetical protein
VIAGRSASGRQLLALHYCFVWWPGVQCYAYACSAIAGDNPRVTETVRSGKHDGAIIYCVAPVTQGASTAAKRFAIWHKFTAGIRVRMDQVQTFLREPEHCCSSAGRMLELGFESTALEVWGCSTINIAAVAVPYQYQLPRTSSTVLYATVVMFRSCCR